MNVVPLSSSDCTDPIAHLIAHDSQAIMNEPIAVAQTLNTQPPTSSGSDSYDGAWNLRVTIDSCYVFTQTVPITIAGGAFSGHLFTYCAEPVNGTTRLSTGGCGADITEDVALTLTIDGHDISGNLTMNGGGCSGSEGVEGNFSSATVGQAGSFFGQLDFTR
jgi:hypothetical protein